MNVFWHQRDLRVPDNRGLAVAGRNGPALPVYVLDPAILDRLGERQRAFFLAGVAALRRRYRERGSDLVLREGAPEDVLPDVVDTFDADRLVYNEHYQPYRRDRQRRVVAALDVPVTTTVDLVLVDPDRLEPRYETHGRFYEDWQAIDNPAPVGEPAVLADVADPTPVPDQSADIELPEAGYRAARERFDSFLDDGIERYRDVRDDLTAAVEAPTNSVSRISPYLAAGMIGIRELWADATDRYEAATDTAAQIQKYRSELAWRESNYHLLYHTPRLASDNYRSVPQPIQWRSDETGLRAWKRGETGYPLVDAGMRQLAAEGYVHNRPRQVVASFLTKHLLIDWRTGLSFFAEQLLDHDPACDAGNWQWIASTGTDSVDVRIFDPVAQMAKYDPDATFVRRYVPELRGIPAETIVDWPTLPREERVSLAPAYPDPIVDREAAYDRAQRVFETALGKR